MQNPKVFMDIEIAGTPAGRIIFELFSDTTPKTAENFRALCTGEKGNDNNSRPLHYKGHNFISAHRGKFVLANGNEQSIYGPGYFMDENFVNKHTGPGILSMGNNGKHSNNSRFFICTSEYSAADFRNVVFGKVVDGMDVVYAIENSGERFIEHSESLLDIKHVVIADCGQLKQGDHVESLISL
ncbi:hypothetical protein DCAR_0730005 [Daucus carota subsp. sativus]|uniref:Peptidyl-prolyl cis-trans isomerase n=1 Tax=Daucus carota subsp. sativus TaxID=79200 RepID=A0A164ULM5_DAUCS|nr:PREDICTED: peptidyl-prolyl cis-trans isomerase-like isoform X2 [Daucus carota subsp. sativus]WOH10536.1 hypothetical protein DCAR_0730005 [Daucus carota subsp. sativus]